jgi:DNA helicase HerA-like ATPase
MRHRDSSYVERYEDSNPIRGFHDTAGRVAEIASIDHDVEIKALDFPGGAVVHVVDLSSLQREHARNTLALAVLRALWRTSREQWWHRHLTKKKASRTATFVVVDEAHHLCPEGQMESPIGLRVRESLLEIATEGRKYGLWLVLGTQRPTRLHPTILSEISNFMLMRTTSPADLERLSNLLSNERINSDLAKLERANANGSWGFLAGEWAKDGYEKVKVSLRQTAHIEGSFKADEWVLPG